MDVKSYTRLLRSTVFQELYNETQGELMNVCHAVDDSTTTGALKAHDMRKGGEIALNYMLTQRTTADEERAAQLDEEPTFGADAILKDMMNP